MEVKSKENVLYSEGAEAVAQVARDMVDVLALSRGAWLRL